MNASYSNTRKISPSLSHVLKPVLKPDGTPDDNDRVEIGPTQLAFDEWAAAGLDIPHLPTLREQRLQRLVTALRARDLDALLVTDPLNIRYASDSTI